MTVNELKYVYIEETMSALGNEELMEAILDAVRKVKVKFQERQEVSEQRLQLKNVPLFIFTTYFINLLHLFHSKIKP